MRRSRRRNSSSASCSAVSDLRAKVGCDGVPLGLSMARSISSSWTIREGSSAADSVDANDCRWQTTSAPAATGRDCTSTRRRSIETAPAAISARARRRESCGMCSASSTSSRLPASSARTTSRWLATGDVVFSLSMRNNRFRLLCQKEGSPSPSRRSRRASATSRPTSRSTSKRSREARGRGVDLVVFPELSLTGYLLRDMVSTVALRLDAPELKHLKKLSQKIAILVGLGRGDPRRSASTTPRCCFDRGDVAARPPQGLPADLRHVRRAALLRARRPRARLRQPLRPRRHPDLRGPVASLDRLPRGARRGAVHPLSVGEPAAGRVRGRTSRTTTPATGR